MEFAAVAALVLIASALQARAQNLPTTISASYRELYVRDGQKHVQELPFQLTKSVLFEATEGSVCLRYEGDAGGVPGLFDRTILKTASIQVWRNESDGSLTTIADLQLRKVPVRSGRFLRCADVALRRDDRVQASRVRFARLPKMTKSASTTVKLEVLDRSAPAIAAIPGSLRNCDRLENWQELEVEVEVTGAPLRTSPRLTLYRAGKAVSSGGGSSGLPSTGQWRLRSGCDSPGPVDELVIRLEGGSDSSLFAERILKVDCECV